MATILKAGNVASGAQITSDATGILEIRTGTGSGTTAMTVNTSQNVGFGVTPSAWGSGTTALETSGQGAIYAAAQTIGMLQNAFYNGSNYIYKASQPSSFYYQSGGAHNWFGAPSGTANNTISFTQILAVERARSLALEGASTQAGTGITFPATQSASSNANTLDDYEEGLASVYISDGTTSLGPYNMVYTKIGRTVTIGFSFYNVNVSTLNTTGRLRITGMPFPEALEQAYSAPIFYNSSGRNYIAVISSSVLSYYMSNTAVDTSNLTRADLGSPSNISFFGSFTYQAA
jgi:hypothetical protein